MGIYPLTHFFLPLSRIEPKRDWCVIGQPSSWDFGSTIFPLPSIQELDGNCLRTLMDRTRKHMYCNSSLTDVRMSGPFRTLGRRFLPFQNQGAVASDTHEILVLA